ncbi:MAG: DUF924 family protein [Candidatus Binatia bacterium]
MQTPSRAEEILTFWFGEPRDDQTYYEAWHKRWFTTDPHFDQEIRERFLDDYHRAAARELHQWQETPRSGLALVVLLDQFPRNMFRGTAQAFATDAYAREVAKHLVTSALDRDLLPIERSFVYMPFMHSEEIADQQLSVSLFSQLAQERAYLDSLSFARRHQEIIRQFGRFPHRNATLGRLSTPAEITFLQQPGSSF